MWNEEKQQIFDDLREIEFARPLTDDERQQLEALFAELDQEEEEMLRPAMERSLRRERLLDEQIAEKRASIARLEVLAARQERLRARAQALLAELLKEQADIQAEYDWAGETLRAA